MTLQDACFAFKIYTLDSHVERVSIINLSSPDAYALSSARFVSTSNTVDMALQTLESCAYIHRGALARPS